MEINLFELEPEKIYGMKANEDRKQEKINQCINSDNYVASIKKDGQYHRYVKYNNKVKMQSRGKSVKTGSFGEVQEKIPHLMDYLNKVVPNNSLIIGELYRPGWTTNEVGSILRCLPPKAILRQKENLLIFYIHDVWFYNGENLMLKTKTERIQKLKEIQENWIHNFGMISEIEFAEYVDTVNEIKEMMAYTFNNNEEGIVLTLKNSFINPGSRTAWKTLKIKKELQNDADVFLTGNYKEPTKNYTGKEIQTWKYWMSEKTDEFLEGEYYDKYIEGAAIIPITKSYFLRYPGSLEIAVMKDGKVFPVGWLSGLTEEIKKDFYMHRENYINKICKINAMETTEDYKFRHAKFLGFRDDINIEDCSFEKIFNKEDNYGCKI